jgi:hypothetical protein
MMSLHSESGKYTIFLPELPLPLPYDACVETLGEIASHAQQSVVAMQNLHQHVREQLASEARVLRREIDPTRWADDARRRLVAPLWACGMYGSEWDLSIGNYASLLMSISTLLPRYAEVAAKFHSLTEQLTSLHYEAERMPELVIVALRGRHLSVPAPLLRVVSRF